ncbi:tyrosine protein phosphatase [Starmerella bacillaris]|uniref:protein-tyrosine-phosphatase n=1 Tax=Starmerella bacillaris TaxID=1247836 RepID=A0AAV5RLN9_STABA|nr:tyrosine protein phosphatase [Starmerella bacillaris]
MDKVAESVYLGEYEVFSTPETLKGHGITHVLSLLNPSSSTDLRENYPAEYLTFQVNDVEDEDIVQYFQESFEYIHNAVENGGNVFVHCVSGVSRSAAFVCAYLMYLNKWTLPVALKEIEKSRPQIKINDGFLEQLEIYYLHGYQVNSDSKLYREWKLKQNSVNNIIYTKTEMAPFKLSWRNIIPHLVSKEIAQSAVSVIVNGTKFSITEFVPRDLNVADLKSVTVNTETNEYDVDLTQLQSVLQKAVQRVTQFRCRMCSAKLATSTSLVRHNIGTAGRCQHFFLEPVEWMRPELEKSALEGRFSCHSCNRKVGAYYWQGSRCSCGTWVTPAFKLSKDKVDEMVSRK